MENKKKLEWKELGRECICSTRVVNVNKVRSVSPTNKEGNYVVLDAPSWVIIVPVLKDENGKESFVMVEQWRHGGQSISREFPGGVVDEGEEPSVAAHRELLEETGYDAKNIIFLGKVRPNPAIMSNTLYAFAATELKNTEEQHLDEDEYVNYFVEDAEKVFMKMGDSPYDHGLMLAAMQLYQRYKKTLN